MIMPLIPESPKYNGRKDKNLHPVVLNKYFIWDFS